MTDTPNPERDPLKCAALPDRAVCEQVAEAFSVEYRHGYWLKELLRRPDGSWLCVWERRLESYRPDFDWTPE